MNVYFISGLAADRGVFKHLRLPQGFEAVYLDWLQPFKNESLEAYAIRLAEKIDNQKPFIIVGLSLGGMLAAEISKHFNPENVIIISSIPSAKHLPTYFKLAGKLKLHKILPVSVIKSAALIKRIFTSETPEDKIYLRRTIRTSDPVFIKWAINAVLNWKTQTLPQKYIHIHGTGDEIFPVKISKPTHIVKGGGHLMIMNRSEEINHILNSLLVTHLTKSSAGA